MRFQLGEELVIRQKGPGNLLSTWRLLRDTHPDREWQQWFTVWGQHSANCDQVCACWVSDHIHDQFPEQPKMIVTDCLGASWAPPTVQQCWINSQPAFPLAAGTTPYVAVPDTHVHPTMKAALRSAKNGFQEEADREFQLANVQGQYQWGPWETATVVSQTLKALDQKEKKNQSILIGAIQNQLLVFRPDAQGKLVSIDDLSRHQKSTSRYLCLPTFRGIPKMVAENRMEAARGWPAGVPLEPDWTVLDRLGNYLDQGHHPAEDPEDPESAAVVLDGRFADLALTPEQIQILVRLEARIQQLPHGSSQLVKRAQAQKTILNKKTKVRVGKIVFQFAKPEKTLACGTRSSSRQGPTPISSSRISVLPRQKGNFGGVPLQRRRQRASPRSKPRGSQTWASQSKTRQRLSVVTRIRLG